MVWAASTVMRSPGFILFIFIFRWQIILSHNLTGLAYLEKKMKAVNIIPKIITKLPQQLLEIEYMKYQKITPGALYTRNDIKGIPNVTWVSDPPPVYYTLAIMGINEWQLFRKKPCEERFRTPFIEMIRWLIVNIPGTDIEKGTIIYPYRHPIAPTGYGNPDLHLSIMYHKMIKLTNICNCAFPDRLYYMFVVYKQTKGIDTILLRFQHGCDLREFNRGFKQDFQDVQQFIDFYSLGDFVGANFFEYELSMEEFEINKRYPQTI